MSARNRIFAGAQLKVLRNHGNMSAATVLFVLKAVLEEEAQFYRLIREVLVANLHNHPANICIEVGRQNTPHQVRPSFADLEQALAGT